MTVDTNAEAALFTMDKEVEVASPKPRGRKRSSAEVATTSTGENAQQIMGAWIDKMTQSTGGVPVPSNIVKRLAKQVKSLISSGYETNQIKNGLTIWTVRWMDNPMVAPEHLERLTWKLVMDSSPEGRQFQEELKSAVTRFAGHTTAVSAGASKQEQRRIENTRGKMNWRERYAERKRREEELES